MLDMDRKSNIVKESLPRNIRSSWTLKVISVNVQHGHRCYLKPDMIVSLKLFVPVFFSLYTTASGPTQQTRFRLLFGVNIHLNRSAVWSCLLCSLSPTLENFSVTQNQIAAMLLMMASACDARCTEPPWTGAIEKPHRHKFKTRCSWIPALKLSSWS